MFLVEKMVDRQFRGNVFFMEGIRGIRLERLLGDALRLGGGIQQGLLRLPAQNSPLQKILLPAEVLRQGAALGVQGLGIIRLLLGIALGIYLT